MSTKAMQVPDPAVLDANLTALEKTCTTAAGHLRQAQAPPSARFTSARDGSPTYVWQDKTGRLRWLGRTSMPTISAEALVNAFQPGSGNVLLAGFGQGREAVLLLSRMAPHQAVLVLDENAWAVESVLRLHDFADDLQRGRLLIFTGDRAWEEMRDFLIDRGGYLVPERVLSWPWFDAETISRITDRLLATNTAVARARQARREERAGLRPPAAQRGDAPSIAVVSNFPDPAVWRLADRLAAGAGALEYPCHCFVLNDPARVHPRAVEDALTGADPTILILLGVGPDALRHALPPAPCVVVCTHRQPLAEQWVRRLPPGTRVGVLTREQKKQVIAFGMSADHVFHLAPAAVPGLIPGAPPGGKRVLVNGDGADLAAEESALQQTSHRQLWQAAAKIIHRDCDEYRDEAADEVLQAAERKLAIRITSDDIRTGLAGRIREVLGPAIIRRECCRALIDAGIAFDLYGAGWERDPDLARFHRGPWPSAERVQESLAGHAAIISIEPAGTVHPALLDGVAAGLVGIVRSHPADGTEDGLAAVLDPDRHVFRFDSRKDLVELARKALADSRDIHERAAAAARHVNGAHTWAHRVQSILAAVL